MNDVIDRRAFAYVAYPQHKKYYLKITQLAQVRYGPFILWVKCGL